MTPAVYGLSIFILVLTGFLAIAIDLALYYRSAAHLARSQVEQLSNEVIKAGEPL